MHLKTTEDVLRRLHTPLACLEHIDELSTWLNEHWFEFVVHCSELMICTCLPALLAPLGQKLTLPSEMQEMLDAVSEANRKRNATLVQEYDLIRQILTDAGTKPSPLKGIALLEQNIYSDNHQRMVGDIDLAITPAELPAAVSALRFANYTQMANRYDSKNLKDDIAFLPIEENDFRNTLEFIDCHIPRIARPGQFDTLELHVHVTNRSSILSPWLDAHARKNDALFHLMHNFEHTHRKDAWATMGRLDWRHLMDAAKRLELDDSGILPRAMMRVASNHKLDADMAVHLYQLQQYLAVPGLSDLIAKPQYSRAIATFEKRHNHPLSQRSVLLKERLKKGVHGVFSPAVLRERYGPKPFHQALLKSIGFYGSRVLRGDLSRDI